jgi:hypothetical protein
MDTERKEHFEGDKDPSFGEVERFFRMNFNTDLSPEEEFRFHDWADRESKKRGRDVLEDLTDYDLRGAFKAGNVFGANGHGSDQWKKPNHPTFSNESAYHGTNDLQHGGAYEGGAWGKTPDGFDSFKPSRKMLDTTHPQTWLNGYMKDAEPDVMLLMPD